MIFPLSNVFPEVVQKKNVATSLPNYIKMSKVLLFYYFLFNISISWIVCVFQTAMLNEFIEFTINNEFKSWKYVLNALSTLYPIFGFVDSLSYL